MTETVNMQQVARQLVLNSPESNVLELLVQIFNCDHRAAHNANLEAIKWMKEGRADELRENMKRRVLVTDWDSDESVRTLMGAINDYFDARFHASW